MDEKLNQDLQSQKALSILEYFHESRSGLYSVLIVLPLVLSYQLILWFTDIDKINGADYLLQKLFKIIGVTGMHVVSLSLLVAFFVAFIYHLRKRGFIEIHARYVILMLLESSCYAFIMYFVMHYLLDISQPLSIFAEKVALTLSSGVYEELIFRVFILSGLYRVFRLFWGDTKILNSMLAVFFSSLIFSYFHFVGPIGQMFNWLIFLIIVLLGGMLAIIYTIRGFGIAVYAHTIFNVLVQIF